MKIKEILESDFPDLSQPFVINHEKKRYWKTSDSKNGHTAYDEKDDDNKPTGNRVWRHSSGKIVSSPD